MRITPFSDPRARFRAGRFGMRLFLFSLGMLFGASLLGYVVIWDRTRPWPADLPRLPQVLWISTAILLLSSVMVQGAVRAARNDRPDAIRWFMLLTTYAGIAFLFIQLRAWLGWFQDVSQLWADWNEFRYALAGFFVLTGLHAAHVVGGLVPMVIVSRQAMLNRYSSTNRAALTYMAMYWHFLDVVWIVLFAALKITIG